MVVVFNPLFESVAVAGVWVLVGAHPEVVCHVLVLQKSFGTGKGEHRVVGEMGS